MAVRDTSDSMVEDHWEESPRKRLKPSCQTSSESQLERTTCTQGETDPIAENRHGGHSTQEGKEKTIMIVHNAKLAPQTVGPFLARHIPGQYAPLGDVGDGSLEHKGDPNSRFCYRHRPDMLCRRQADEPSMAKLQKGLEDLSQDDRQGIAHVWSLFSAAPSKHKNLMLQGILAQCCFPQLSYLSANVRDLIRIDFLSALPSEVGFRILCFLDTTSLCKAAQVSRRWRQLADDDVVWHRMCEQHIDRKCTRCGWGLPLLERKRLRATKRQIQLRLSGREPVESTEYSSSSNETIEPPVQGADQAPEDVSDLERTSDGRLSPVSVRSRPGLVTSDSEYSRKTRPWKDIYKDRFKVGTNWKYGRFSSKIFTGHTNGIMCLQFYDNILATGSYDATIKIWDIETGEELRTLRGHTSGIRCLQFDDTKLISGSLDKTLRVWNWRTGECISTYTGHSEGVVSLHFDANVVVSASIDKTAKVWNFADKSIFTLRGHSDWVNSVKIDTPSRTVFTASDDFTVKMWDLDTKKCVRTFEGHVGHVQQVLLLPVEFEADEDMAGTASGDMSHSTSSAAELMEDDRPPPPTYMLTSSLDSTARLWHIPSGRCVRTFFGHVEGVWALAADTLRIVTGAEDRTVKVWDPRTGKCERTFTGHAGPVTCVGLSDSRMCSGSEDGEVRMWSFGE